MLIRPELQALRSDDAPQRHAQAELQHLLKDWRASRLGTGLERSIVAYARGEAIEHLPPFARLFTPGDPSARRLTGELIDRFAAVLLALPWGQVPLPGKVDDASATIVLAAAGNAALILQAYDGAGLRRRPPVPTVSFSPGETHDHVLAGSATARLIELRSESAQGAELTESCCELGAGQITKRDGAQQALLMDAAATTLVVLRLQRRPMSGSVTREFSLADGWLVHRAAGSARDSRYELAVALLGRMGRSDAVLLLAAMSEEQGSESLRWQSLKECLGLDTATGFAALERIAGRADDPLAGPAMILRTELLETYPQLAGSDSCPE